MNQVTTIANRFCETNEVRIISKGVFHSWHSRWLINGRAMSSAGVKRLLIPAVMKSIGPDPKALKQIIWKILAFTQIN